MINKETQQAIKVAKLLGELFTELSTICGKFADMEEVNNVSDKVEEAIKEIAPLKEVPKGTVIEEETEVEEETEELSMEEQLKALSMKDLKEIAKDKGLKLSGKKEDLIARILGDTEEEVIEEVEEEVPTEEVEEVQEVEEVIEETEEVEEEVEESLSDKITRELEGYSDDEIKEILEGVEMSTKGKRQALISRVVEAVEQGLLEFESEEEEEIEPTDYEEEEVLEMDDFVNEDEEEEIVEDEEEEVELSEREEAQARIKEEIQLKYSKKKLTDKEIEKFLDEHFNGRFKAKDKKRALAKYMEVFSELVDDEGEVHEMEDPYYVDETPYCCGSELSELENGNLYCEHCGNEYETE